MEEETYEGIPRNLIPWAPRINYKKCVACGKCIDFCHMQAFGFAMENDEKKTIVKNLNACVVFCRGCEEICPTGAITHPQVKKTRTAINKLKEDLTA